MFPPTLQLDEEHHFVRERAAPRTEAHSLLIVDDLHRANIGNCWLAFRVINPLVANQLEVPPPVDSLTLLTLRSHLLINLSHYAHRTPTKARSFTWALITVGF
jgi:hypothetical protein